MSLLLLDYVAELPASIKQFVSKEADLIFNKPPHDLAQDELIEKLMSLQEAGYISVQSVDGVCWNLRRKQSTTFDVLELFVLLTPKGGSLWEKVYKPDWQKFILVEVDSSSGKKEKCVLRSLNERRLKGILEKIKKLGEVGCLSSITSWNATYWKMFEEGYQLEFEALIDEADTVLVEERMKWCLTWREITS